MFLINLKFLKNPQRNSKFLTINQLILFCDEWTIFFTLGFENNLETFSCLIVN